MFNISRFVIDWQLIVSWGTDSCKTEGITIFKFSLHCYCVLRSAELPLNCLLAGMVISNVIICIFQLLNQVFCYCDLHNHQSWLRYNHHVRWLFKDKSWGQRFALTGDWTRVIAMSYNDPIVIKFSIKMPPNCWEINWNSFDGFGNVLFIWL